MKGARVFDGKKFAKNIELQLATTVWENVGSLPNPPVLAVVMVGNREDSKVYVRMKQACAGRVGIVFKAVKLPVDVQQNELEEKIRELGDEVDGLILQLPLPPHLNKERALECIPPRCDVDGLHPYNLGKLSSSRATPFHAPCTPEAVIAILEEMHLQLSGMHVVLVGMGDLVGRPLASELLRKNATVTCCHSCTKNIKSLTQMGHVVISAVGKAGLIKEDWIKPGAIVIDVGISSVTDSKTGKKKIVGDVDFESVQNKASLITPVPGGVGPMTVVMLMKAVVNSWMRNHHRL